MEEPNKQAYEREMLASMLEGVADTYILAAELTRAGKLEEASRRLERALKSLELFQS